MRWQPWIASALVAVGMASCGENSPPDQSHSTMKPALLKTSAPGAVTNAKASPQPVRPGGNDAPTAPADTQWTILCDAVEGPGHVENARDLKAMLARQSGMPDWYVVHTANESTIYYGFYRSLQNPAEKKRAELDRRRIGMLTDKVGNPMIRGNVLVAYSAPDPDAPPDWNLLNTPKNAYWSIEIATFAGNPRRKEAAVEMVRQLRDAGEKMAYYYHGPTASSVCIGAWPREAVKEQGTGIDKRGNMRDDAHARNADQPIVVFGGDAIPPNLIASDVREPGTGKRMVVEGMRLEYQDPQMQEKAKEYPEHYVNYERRGIVKDGRTVPDPSVLVVIPRDQSGTGEDDSMLTGGPSRMPDAQPVARPSVSTTPGDSVLRSIEGK